MNRQNTRNTGRFLFAVIFAVVMTALTGFTALAGEKVNIKEGTYYIKAVNGNAKGKVLYWNKKAEDQNICMMFDSIGSKNEEQAVWFIRKNRNFDDYYGIYLYSDYNPKNEFSLKKFTPCPLPTASASSKRPRPQKANHNIDRRFSNLYGSGVSSRMHL